MGCSLSEHCMSVSVDCVGHFSHAHTCCSSSVDEGVHFDSSKGSLNMYHVGSQSRRIGRTLDGTGGTVARHIRWCQSIWWCICSCFVASFCCITPTSAVGTSDPGTRPLISNWRYLYLCLWWLQTLSTHVTVFSTLETLRIQSVWCRWRSRGCRSCQGQRLSHWDLSCVHHLLGRTLTLILAQWRWSILTSALQILVKSTSTGRGPPLIGIWMGKFWNADGTILC